MKVCDQKSSVDTVVLEKEDELVQMLWDITDTQDNWDKMKEKVN
jgi:hypothetical protein